MVVSITSKESIWMLADRRISRGEQTVRDDARKILLLNTQDAFALIGYAGLGATNAGTEPSEWMSNVLRGRNLPLESCLGVLADAARAQLPRHLRAFDIDQHHMLAAAMVDGEPELRT